MEPSRLLTTAEKVDRTARSYAAEAGEIAYVFAARRDDIAAGVEQWVARFEDGETVDLGLNGEQLTSSEWLAAHPEVARP